MKDKANIAGVAIVFALVVIFLSRYDSPTDGATSWTDAKTTTTVADTTSTTTSAELDPTTTAGTEPGTTAATVEATPDTAPSEPADTSASTAPDATTGGEPTTTGPTPIEPTDTATGPADNTTSTPIPAAGDSCTSILAHPTATVLTAARTAANTIPVAKVITSPTYNRDDWPHWVDVDNDGFDGRQQALGLWALDQDRALVKQGKVIAGEWCDPYTSKVFTDPTKLDVDHFDPLSEAHKSGGATWTTDAKQAFANDNTGTLDTGIQLLPVSAGQNRAKGDKDPSQWMPADPTVHCGYLANWVLVKARYGLSWDESEQGYVVKHLAACA